ncbi:hypothetical protein LTR28_006946 [Elasticomyces elasticus]|nr:hypothetical protein LTR28_006946 [Elasticomyces elasticus]
MPGNIHDVPIAVIESWPAPNYVNPVRRNWMPAYAITLQVVTTILVSARFWSRLKRQAGGFGTDDSFILLAWVLNTMDLIAMYGTYITIFSSQQLSPLDAYWKAFDLTYTGKYHCANTSVSNPFVGTLSVVTDIYSVVLPGILLRNLRIPTQQKIGLNIIFGLGALVAVAGVVRTYYLTLLSGDDYDTTWTGFNVFIWSQLECQLAIICACAPCLKALFTKYMGESQGRVYNRSNKSTPKISPGTTKSDGWGPLYPTNERPPLRQIDSDRTLVKPSLEVTEEVELPSWTASAHSLATHPQREHESSDP